MKKIHPPALAEIIFDLVYLIFALLSGILLLWNARGRTEIILYGWMTLVLAGGDSVHLIPRIRAQASGDMARFARSLSFGRLVASITMTVFYLLLYFVWAFQLEFKTPILTALVLFLVAARIFLCLFPQNDWFSPHASLQWAFYRNLPFFILGALVAILFAATSSAQPAALQYMSVAVLLSFLFYAPVVFLSSKYSKIGMLMLPKTCCYVWIIFMGLVML